VKTSALAISLLTLLWKGDLGEQRTCLVTRDLVLVPCGTKLTALSATDGKVAWEYPLEEQHGPLRVPCRIQGIQLLPRPVVRLPGISPPSVTGGSTPGSVCLAGQAELHCLSLPAGKRLWKALKDDGCILSLHKVGDVDADGMEDLVSCGCNFAECFSGRTGADLWREPVSGRSLWAGACGDLNGDGLGEVLLQAGTELRVMSAKRPGRVTTLFKVNGFLPRVSLPRDKGFLVGFGGASAWLWTGDGKGRRTWDAKAHLIDAYSLGGQSVIATKQGIWVELEDGRWSTAVAKNIRTAAPTNEGILLVTEKNELFELAVQVSRRHDVRRLFEFPHPVDGLRVDAEGKLVVALSGKKCFVYRLDGHNG
jgi:hypothetical protein